MFNLLPQQEQSDLARDYRLRFAAIGLLLFGLLGVVSLAALTPSIFLSYQKAEVSLKAEELLKRDIALRSEDNLTDILKFAEKQVFVLGSASSSPYVHELVADVILNKTPQIKIAGIHAVRDGGGHIDLTVTGRARDRDTLLEFVKILERERVFTEVTVPVSNFAAAADINFSILAKVK